MHDHCFGEGTAMKEFTSFVLIPVLASAPGARTKSICLTPSYLISKESGNRIHKPATTGKISLLGTAAPAIERLTHARTNKRQKRQLLLNPHNSSGYLSSTEKLA
jgi:hypothetical protein